MYTYDVKNPTAQLETLGIKNYRVAHWNKSPEWLMEATVERQQGVLADSGALVIQTGKFTGRSPQDRFIVKDHITENQVDWNNINQPFSPSDFDQLYTKITDYFAGREVFVRDAFACANENYRLPVRVVNEYPWSNLFVYNMFIRPTTEEFEAFEPEWTVINAPGFLAIPQEDGTRQSNFSIINFARKCIIVGGSGYTGEIKKGVFSVLNFTLPTEQQVLSMHASANVGQEGDVAIFFGLSGTGKTTLSTDPNRALIGDDEHGWAPDGVFNFEGGCYAKTIDLSQEKEPEIYAAIKHGAILENIQFHPGTRTPDYSDTTITQNTRVSYPIHHIDNALAPSKAGLPKNIFFLTCDAFGVLPPISKLTPAQAAYYFISGYTAKVAGTEAGVNEPQPVFSAGFGAPFLPLHPGVYAEMLSDKIERYDVNVWLVNTGWANGPCGTGSRMQLPYTRAMITAALEGNLDQVAYKQHSVFGVQMPLTCPNVPDHILSPRQCWQDDSAFYQQANKLARLFNENFEQFESGVSNEILEAAPKENLSILV